MPKIRNHIWVLFAIFKLTLRKYWKTDLIVKQHTETDQGELIVFAIYELFR